MLSQLAKGRGTVKGTWTVGLKPKPPRVALTSTTTIATTIHRSVAATRSSRCVGRSTAFTRSQPLVISSRQSSALHRDVSARTIRTASVLAARTVAYPVSTMNVRAATIMSTSTLVRLGRAGVTAFSTRALAAVATSGIREREWAARATQFSTVAATAAAAVLAGAGIATCESGERREGGELARAVARGDHSSVRRLLAGGTDANERHPAGWTPLHAAAVRGDGDLCEILLDAGADPNAEDT